MASRIRVSLLLCSVCLACSAQVSGGDSPQVNGTLAIQPSTATVPPGGTQSFAAATISTAITWSVQESGGGTITSSGYYTAPSTLGTYHVVATAVGASGVSGTATVTVSSAPTTDLIPAARRTTWDPGVPGGIPSSSTFTVYGGAALSLGSDAATNRTTIQNAIAAAGALASATRPYVVLLPSGTYSVAGTINLSQDYVVLKGAGKRVNNAGSGAGGTRLVETTSGVDMFHAGGGVTYGAAYAISNADGGGGDIPAGASSFTAAAGHGIQAGNMIVIDKADDSDVVLEGSTWWKRGPANNTLNGDPPSSVYRSRGQVAEVQSVNGNVITIVGVVHMPLQVSLSPQVYHSTSRPNGWAGVGLEEMTITGWRGSLGFWANNVRRSWIKHVEFDGLPTSQTFGGAGGLASSGVGPGTQGVDMRWYKSVRNNVETSYLHHSISYQTNDNAYSISLGEQSSDMLIQDNIVWFKNKNIVLESAGSGNVIAYNYLEDPVISANGTTINTSWMEMCLDGSHAAAPVFNLFEGNYVSKMGAAETHGNATDLTFFRNYSSGTRRYSMTENAAVAAVMLNRYMYRMNFVGNVLSTMNLGGDAVYELTFNSSGMVTPINQQSVPKIWSNGLDGYNGNWGGPWDPTVDAQLIRVGNYDYVRRQVDTVPSQTIPNSLYLAGKPAFFGSYTWPWVNALGSTDAQRVMTLPAKARFDAGTP